jgi:hypothetical protein
MKTLKFNFTHPFKGHARVNMPGLPNSPCTQLSIDSHGGNLVEIPLDNYQKGKYKITLDWEADNRFFIHHQEFQINENPNLIPAIT